MNIVDYIIRCKSLAGTKVFHCKSVAKRAIAQGAVLVNGKPETSIEADVSKDDIVSFYIGVTTKKNESDQ